MWIITVQSERFRPWADFMDWGLWTEGSQWTGAHPGAVGPAGVGGGAGRGLVGPRPGLRLETPEGSDPGFFLRQRVG